MKRQPIFEIKGKIGTNSTAISRNTIYIDTIFFTSVQLMTSRGINVAVKLACESRFQRQSSATFKQCIAVKLILKCQKLKSI